jgi:hypothetical protein
MDGENSGFHVDSSGKFEQGGDNKVLMLGFTLDLKVVAKAAVESSACYGKSMD